MFKDGEDDSQGIELQLEPLHLSNLLDVLIPIVEPGYGLLPHEFLSHVLFLLGGGVDRVLSGGQVGDDGEGLIVLSHLYFGVGEVALGVVDCRFGLLYEVVLRVFTKDVDDGLGVGSLLLLQ